MSKFPHKLKMLDLLKKAGLDNLSPREKAVLAFGIIFVLIFFFVQLVIVPFVDEKEKLRKSIKTKQAELVTIKQLQTEYESLKNVQGNIRQCVEKRQNNFNLFNYLEQNAKKSDIKNQIKSMKPSSAEGDDEFNEIIVDMAFLRTPLQPLVQFASNVESKENCIVIKRMAIKKSGKEQGYFDVTLKIATLSRKELP